MKRNLILFTVLCLSILLFINCAKKKTEEEYNTLIKELTAAKEFDQVIDNYEQLLKFYPESENIGDYKDGYLTVLLQMTTKGTEDEQLKYLEKIVDVFGDEEFVQVDYANFRLAKSLEGKDDVRSEELYGKIDADGYNELARYLISEEQFEAALDCYKKQLQYFPNDENKDKMIFMIGYIYGEYLKDYESAKKYFQEVIEEFPESELRDDAEWMYENVGKPLEDIVFEKNSEETEKKSE
ncbi:tetratricopeptide repeat protein [bacterium]|nr:tetratricopeptide repeat protein [bacterium]